MTAPRSGRWPAAAIVVAGSAAVAYASHGALLAVVAVGAVLFGVVVIIWSDAAALAAVALTFSNATVVAVHDHGAPGAVRLLVPVLLLTAAGHQVLGRRLPVVIPRPTVWLVALLLVEIVSALASRDPEPSVAAAVTLLIEGLVLFGLVVNAIRGRQLVRWAALVLVVTAGLLGALSLVQEVSGGTRQDFGGFASMSNAVIGRSQGGGTPRHAGPIGEQNRWAQSLAVVLPIAIALGMADRSRTVRLLAWASGFGIAVGVILTYSRGAAVGLILTALIGIGLRWIRVSTAVVAAAVVLLVLALAAPRFTERASTVVSARSSAAARTNPDAAKDGSFANRYTEGLAAGSVFLRHPVLGVGPGLFPTYFQDEARAQGADRIVGVNREAHNLYLGLAAETGVLGLVAFGGFVASLLGSLARVRRAASRASEPDLAALATGFALAIVTYLTTGLFLHFAYIRYFWLLAALAAAVGMLAAIDGPDAPAPDQPQGRRHVERTEPPSRRDPRPASPGADHGPGRDRLGAAPG